MVTVRVNDFEAHPMDYFDMAWDGEDVLIPRTGNKNVCIISESQYRHLLETKKDSEALFGMTDRSAHEVLARSVEELRLV